MLKKWLFITLLAVGQLALSGADVNVTLRPSKFEAGESVQLRLNVTGSHSGSGQVILPELPDGAYWNYNVRSDSTRMSIDSSGNRQVSSTFVRQFTVDKPGKFEMPPITVKFPGTEYKSKPFTIDVAGKNSLKRNRQSDSQGTLQATVTTMPDRPLYPGELVKIELKIYVPANCTLADLRITGISGLGLNQLLNGNRGFRLGQHYFTERDSREYNVYPVTGWLRTMESGEFFPEAGIVVEIQEHRKREHSSYGDDIFESFFNMSGAFGRRTERRLHCRDDRGFKVLPMPPLPAGALDTGLTGRWQLTAKFTAPSCRSGELTELEIRCKPLSPVENPADIPVKAPVFDWPDFRIYPAEVIRKNGIISIRYAMIPLNPGEKHLNFSLAAFDPANGRYNVSRQKLTLAVTPGKVNSTAAAATPLQKAETLSTPENIPVNNDRLNYLKTAGKQRIAVPLWLNQRFAVWSLIAGGILLLLLDGLCRRFRSSKLKENYRKHRQLKQLINSLTAELKKSSDPTAVLQQQELSALAEFYGLPPGAGIQEIADCIDDPETKRLFSAAATSGFAPAAAGAGKTEGFNKKQILNYLKHLVILLIAAAVPLMASAAENSALNFFDQGNYRQAVIEYRKELRQDQLDPALLYNIGCAEFRLGNYPEARLWFSRAALLMPGDPEILGNLELVGEKLQLEPAAADQSFNTQISAFRDRLMRPDQYLLCAAISFFILCILLLLRERGGRIWRWSIFGAVLFLMIVFLISALEQADGSYSSQRLILTGTTVEIRSLPVENSGSVTARVNGGGEARLIEQRGGWLRISSGGHEGWIKANQAEKIFPYGVF